MKRRDFLLCASAACAVSLAGEASPVLAAGDGKTIALKKPEGGKPLVHLLQQDGLRAVRHRLGGRDHAHALVA